MGPNRDKNEEPEQEELKEEELDIIVTSKTAQISFGAKDSKAFTKLQHQIKTSDETRMFDDTTAALHESPLLKKIAPSILPIDEERNKNFNDLKDDPDYMVYSLFDANGQFKKKYQGKFFGTNESESAAIAFVKQLTQEARALTLDPNTEEIKMHPDMKSILAMGSPKSYYEQMKEKGYSDSDILFYAQTAVCIVFQYPINDYAIERDTKSNWPEDKILDEKYLGLFNNTIGSKLISNQRVLYQQFKDALNVIKRKLTDEKFESHEKELFDKVSHFGTNAFYKYFENMLIDPVSAIYLINLANDILNSKNNPTLKEIGYSLLKKQIAIYEESRGNLSDENQKRLVQQQKAYNALVLHNALQFNENKEENEEQSLLKEQHRLINDQAIALASGLFNDEKTNESEFTIFAKLLFHAKDLYIKPHSTKIVSFINSYETYAAKISALKTDNRWSNFISSLEGLYKKYKDQIKNIDNTLFNSFAENIRTLESNIQNNRFQKHKKLFSGLLDRTSAMNAYDLEFLKIANSIYTIPEEWPNISEMYIDYLKNSSEATESKETTDTLKSNANQINKIAGLLQVYENQIIYLPSDIARNNRKQLQNNLNLCGNSEDQISAITRVLEDFVENRELANFNKQLTNILKHIQLFKESTDKLAKISMDADLEERAKKIEIFLSQMELLQKSYYYNIYNEYKMNDRIKGLEIQCEIADTMAQLLDNPPLNINDNRVTGVENLIHHLPIKRGLFEIMTNFFRNILSLFLPESLLKKSKVSHDEKKEPVKHAYDELHGIFETKQSKYTLFRGVNPLMSKPLPFNPKDKINYTQRTVLEDWKKGHNWIYIQTDGGPKSLLEIRKNEIVDYKEGQDLFKNEAELNDFFDRHLLNKYLIDKKNEDKSVCYHWLSTSIHRGGLLAALEKAWSSELSKNEYDASQGKSKGIVVFTANRKGFDVDNLYSVSELRTKNVDAPPLLPDKPNKTLIYSRTKMSVDFTEDKPVVNDIGGGVVYGSKTIEDAMNPQPKKEVKNK